MSDDLDHAVIPTPTGRFRIETRGDQLVSARWTDEPELAPSTPLLCEIARQIDAYFAGRLRRFDVPLQLGDGEIDRPVREAMIAIPYGETRSYGDLSRSTGFNARIVGGACGRNAIPIVVPCHRVVAANGALTGFSGGKGVATKRQLLVHEGALLL